MMTGGELALSTELICILLSVDFWEDDPPLWKCDNVVRSLIRFDTSDSIAEKEPAGNKDQEIKGSFENIYNKWKVTGSVLKIAGLLDVHNRPLQSPFNKKVLKLTL
jgi:hypothetical protein